MNGTKKCAKRVVGTPQPIHETSIDIDVRPVDLLCDEPDGFLRSVLLEVQKQWGNNMRVGTAYAYFDFDGRLHIHFASRAPLKREGALEKIVEGNLPAYFVNEQSDVYESAAAKAAELMVELPSYVDPNDPGWKTVISALEKLKNSPPF